MTSIGPKIFGNYYEGAFGGAAGATAIAFYISNNNFKYHNLQDVKHYLKEIIDLQETKQLFEILKKNEHSIDGCDIDENLKK